MRESLQIARKGDKCKRCGMAIIVQDHLGYDPALGIVHKDCRKSEARRVTDDKELFDLFMGAVKEVRHGL